MKILVPVKRVPDTDQRIKVRADGAGLDLEQLPFVINPFDAIALEEALRIRESGRVDAEVIAVGIGGEAYEEQLRTALAMGADRAVRAACDVDLDPSGACAVLHAVVQEESPVLVLMGKQAVDDDYNQTGQFLAARLDWPQATFASRIDLQDQSIEVDRETDAGIETVRLSLPAVVTVDLRLNEPRYASLPGIMKAKKRPIEQIDVEALGLFVEPRIKTLAVRMEKSSRRREMLSDVNQLADRIRAESR